MRIHGSPLAPVPFSLALWFACAPEAARAGASLHMRLDAGVSLEDLGNRRILHLGTTAWGRADHMRLFAPAASEGCAEATGGACRMARRDGDLFEWWQPSQGGLEQGWTVQAPPDGSGPLVLEVAAVGARSVRPTAAGLAITDADGGMWTVGALVARDARGRTLDAHMVPAGEAGLRVLVDTSGAAWPVTVDPLYDTPSWSIDGETNADGFGGPIAGGEDLNGDGYLDVVVSARSYDGNDGRVYVYYGTDHGLPDTPDLTLGDDTPGLFGFAVAMAGDTNGDGYGDVIVGAYEASEYGSAVVYYGGPTGLSASNSTSLSHTEYGELSVGYTVSGGGDLNGDGYDDVVVGAPHDLVGVFSYGISWVHVYYGSPAGISPTPEVTLTEVGRQYFGDSVGIVGDLNGDGYADLAVGDLLAGSTGAVHLYLGSASGISTTADQTVTGVSAAIGGSLARVGDVNGDGYDDLLAGASGGAQALIFEGGPSGVSTSPDTTLTGASNFGERLAGVGDVNGDGYADVAVSAPSTSSYAGEVSVFLGSATGVSTTAVATWDGERADDVLGYGISGIGDSDGDGYEDLLIGAPGAGEGFVRLHRGSPDGPETDATQTLWSTAEGTPAAAAAGDLNGDGYGDVAVGFPADHGDLGAVEVFLGGASGLAASPDLTLSGDVRGDRFGSAVQGVGDTNGDGYDDLLVGAKAGDADAGRVSLYLGSASGLSDTPALTLDGDADGDELGGRIRPAGDINGDGYGDVLIEETGSDTLDLYLGNVDGLESTPAAELAGVSDCWGGAGDVNGDGYDDLLVAYDIGTRTSGEVDIYLGEWDGLVSAAVTTLSGDNWYYGDCASRAGDVNGDGYGDVAVGSNTFYVYSDGSIDSYAEEVGAGFVSVYEGTSAGVFSAAAAEPSAADVDETIVDGFGLAIASADINGDGYGDVVVGSPTYEYGYGVRDASLKLLGRVYVFSGSAEGLSTTADSTLTGGASGDELGGAVAAVGDVNGDGYGDVLVGASGAVSGGAYFLYEGYADGDADGVSSAVDCDDADASVGAPSLTWYSDADGDGFGDPDEGTLACTPPDGSVSDDTDCDDTNALVHPGADEVCDGVDDDCDGVVDPAGASGAGTWYVDADGDGYGDPASSTTACDRSDGAVADDADCDDTSASVHPGAAEICDGLDNDCDGVVDPSSAVDAGLWYADSDGDGYGDAASSTAACTAPEGAVADDGDCDDADPAVHPDADETCDGLDDDCDGVVDPASAVDARTWYADADGDGYGNPAAVAVSCASPGGYVEDGADCNDADASIHPAAVEIPDDGIDQDCDGADSTTPGDTGEDSGAGGASGDASSSDGDGDTAPPKSSHGCASGGTTAGPGLWGLLAVAGLLLSRRGRER